MYHIKNKSMKKLITKIGTFSFLLSTLLICTACPKPDPEPEPTPVPSTPLTVNPGEINLGSNAGAQATFTIASSGDWIATCNESWLSLSSNNGSLVGAIIVTALTDNPNGTERTALINVISGTESKTVSVKQAPKEILELSGLDAPFEASVGDIKSAYDLVITCSSTWQIESKPDWLNISALNGNGNSTIKAWTNSANESQQDRPGTIVVKSGNKTATKNVVQRAYFSSCYARAKEYVTLTESFVFGYDFSQNTTMVYFRLLPTSKAKGLTDKDLINDLKNNQSNWNAKTPEAFGNYFSYYGAQANESYTLVSIAIQGNDIGEINRKEFITPKDDVYNSPYIASSSYISVEYASVEGQYSYRIKVDKDSENNPYSSRFYSWAIAGIKEFETLYTTDAILAYYIKTEITRNPSPHDTYVNGSDRSIVRERLEGPLETANYTLPANTSNDAYLQIINWCILDNGSFSGKINWGYLNMSSQSRMKLQQRSKSTPNGIKFVEVSPEKLKESIHLYRID